MIRIEARSLVLGSTLVLGALTGGCTGEVYTQPVAPPPPGYGTTAGYVASPQPDDVDTQVTYVPQPPDDIESYPYVVYDGAPVYFVGGMWYRHGGRGWAYYRDEPADLRRQREDHDRDPRWARAREAPRWDGHPGGPPRPGVAEPQPRDERPVQPEGEARPEGREPTRANEERRVPGPEPVKAVPAPKHVEEATAPPVRRPVGAVHPPPHPAPQAAPAPKEEQRRP